MDTNGDGELNKAEVKAILLKGPLLKKLSDWAAKQLQVGTSD